MKSLFVNVKFSVLIYVKIYMYGGAITVIVLYLPLIYSALGDYVTNRQVSGLIPDSVIGIF